MNRSILVVLAVLLVSATAFSVGNSNGDKVKVDFYYESLCPYCQQYIEKSLKIAANTKVNKGVT